VFIDVNSEKHALIFAFSPLGAVKGSERRVPASIATFRRNMQYVWLVIILRLFGYQLYTLKMNINCLR